METRPADVFKYALKNGIMDYDSALTVMIFLDLKEKVLEHHKYSIAVGSDGRWRTNITDETGRRKTIRKPTEKELYLYLAAYYGIEHKESRHTLATLYPLWLEYKSVHTTAKTYIFRIKTDWKKYYQDDPIVNILIDRLDRIMLDEWAHRLILNYSMSKNTYYNVTVIIRQALQYAADRGMIDRNPFDDVKVDGRRMFRKVRKKPDSQQVFTKEEAAMIFDLAMADFQNRTKGNILAPLCILFQMQTGMRIGEVVCVKYSDLERENYIHVQRMVRRDTHEIVDHTKTECGDRFVLITSEAQSIIDLCRSKQSEYGVVTDFIFSMTDKPVSIWCIRDLYQKYSRKLGVWKMSHTARRTYISALLDGGVNLNTVRTMAGHSSEKTTLQNYLFDRDTDTEKLRKVEQALQFSSP